MKTVIETPLFLSTARDAGLADDMREFIVSTISDDPMNRNIGMEKWAMSKLGKKLIAAAKEGVAIARGEMDPASYRLHVPAKINVRAMRQKLGMTQEEFAIRYGLTLARVRDWEQGRSAPDGAARAYLRVIEKEPEAVDRALAVA
jgi:putative transcriptional regulator